MPIKLMKLKKFVNNNGTLVPVHLNKIKNFKLKRFFILHGKKNRLKEIMLIKNAHRFLFH